MGCNKAVLVVVYIFTQGFLSFGNRRPSVTTVLVLWNITFRRGHRPSVRTRVSSQARSIN